MSDLTVAARRVDSMNNGRVGGVLGPVVAGRHRFSSVSSSARAAETGRVAEALAVDSAVAGSASPRRHLLTVNRDGRFRTLCELTSVHARFCGVMLWPGFPPLELWTLNEDAVKFGCAPSFVQHSTVSSKSLLCAGFVPSPTISRD